MIELSRGDVVLLAFPFIADGRTERKRRPALVVQSDRYNRRRDAVIVAAITSSKTHREIPSKVLVLQASPGGRQGGLRLDSVVDCQTLVTVPKGEIVRRLGTFPAEIMRSIDSALKDALGMNGGVRPAGKPRRR